MRYIYVVMSESSSVIVTRYVTSLLPVAEVRLRDRVRLNLVFFGFIYSLHYRINERTRCFSTNEPIVILKEYYKKNCLFFFGRQPEQKEEDDDGIRKIQKREHNNNELFSFLLVGICLKINLFIRSFPFFLWKLKVYLLWLSVEYFNIFISFFSICFFNSFFLFSLTWNEIRQLKYFYGIITVFSYFVIILYNLLYRH